MDANKLMKSVELERELKIITDEVNNVLLRVRVYVECLEEFYKDKEKSKDFIAEMQMKQAMLLRFVNRLNDIIMQAMAINEQSIVFRCEDIKYQVRDTMETVRNLYM
jgi:hypothetical protein